LGTPPGGSTPSSSRSWPDDPPLSNIVTTACRSTDGSFFRPPSRLGRPVPPPKHPILSVRNFTGLFYARPGRADRPYYNDPVPTPLSLTPALRQALDRMAADLRRVFADRFIALVATTAHSGVAFVTAIQAGDLDALGPLSSTWERDALDPPLLLTPDELRRSLDAFPVEYRALLEKHE